MKKSINHKMQVMNCLKFQHYFVDYVGITSVRVGDGSYDAVPKQSSPPNRSLPPPHVRKVVREGWLAEQPSETKPPPYKPPSGKSRSTTSSGKRSQATDKERLAKPTALANSRSVSRDIVFVSTIKLAQLLNTVIGARGLGYNSRAGQT